MVGFIGLYFFLLICWLLMDFVEVIIIVFYVFIDELIIYKCIVINLLYMSCWEENKRDECEIRDGEEKEMVKGR